MSSSASTLCVIVAEMEERFRLVVDLIQRNQLKEFQNEIKKLNKEQTNELFSFVDVQNLSQTLFHVLASQESSDCIQWTLTLPLECISTLINKQDKQGWTPLHCAAYSGNLKTCKILLEHPDCDTTITTNNNSTALHYIGNYETKGSNENPKQTHWKTNSAEQKHTNLMKSWITKLDNLWMKYKAINSLASEVIDVMLAKGMDINACNANMETPIQMACLRGNKETVLLFILKGAYVFGVNKRGLGCWDYAVNRNDTDIMELLNGFVQLFTDWLSEEILIEIFKHLNPKDLLQIAQVCKLFNRVSQDEFLWNRFLEDGRRPEMRNSKQSWFKEQLYRNYFPCKVDWKLFRNPGGVVRKDAPKTPPTNNNNNNLSKDYDYLFKMLMIGDGGVGKSALLTRFADDAFTESYIPSLSVDFKIITVGFPDAVVKLQVWENESARYRFGRPSFSYRGGQAVMIVFDVTDQVSFNNTKQWLGEVDRYACENINKILVGNKCDLVDKRVVEYNDVKEFADSLDIAYIETSAKNSTNVDKLFAMATSQVIHRLRRSAEEKRSTPTVATLRPKPKKDKGCNVS